jgi:ATP-dependent protease ClpP protease subunit
MAALESKEPINILIDSPGGLVDGGELLLQAMKKLKAHGVPIRCVAKKAESMAMFVLGECTERYALPDSVYLWHPVKATTNDAISAEDAEKMLNDLRATDAKYNPPLRAALGIDLETYQQAWHDEKEWSAEDLMKAAPGFMEPLDSVEGVEWPQELRIPQRIRLPGFP